MTTTHTPGPWKATRRQKRGAYLAAFDITADWPRYGQGTPYQDTHLRIAEVLAHHIGSADNVPGEKPGDLANCDKEGTQAANAALIAAAPALLQAAEYTEAWARDYEERQGVGESAFGKRLRAAIAQARGSK